MNNFFQGKKVLVTGGTGLIGVPLVRGLLRAGADVKVVSLDKESPFEDKVVFIRGDLCESAVCAEAVKNVDVVFHLAGLKGGIGVSQSKASTFLVKNILMNTLLMEVARKANIGRFIYASSICIYPPARIFKEENAWKGFPHPSDRFGGMAKLIGEMQIEAYRLQYHLENFFIARPTNTYGPYDNFNPVSSLIIPALIHRVFKGENPLVIWGDGSAVRDFIFCEDVADFLMLMVAENASGPFNVGSGVPVSIKTVAETVARQAEKFIGKKVILRWDKTKAAGERFRVASIQKAKTQLGWSPKTDLNTGILKTIEWYVAHRSFLPDRYTILSEE